MWGFGGRHYWGRKEDGSRGKVEGIVVMFAWKSSQERHLKSYVQLYSSLGWNSLVCHTQFLNMFFPDNAEAVAAEVLNVIVEELKLRPCPVVFVSFSGGPKECMYKIIQILEGKCEPVRNLCDAQSVRDCISGYIFDFSPVDFTSDLGTRFVLHPSVLKMSPPPRVATWIANTISSSLDRLFLSRFESQRAEYWQTLYSSVTMGAPYLILCSGRDDLTPHQTICNFAQRLQDLGADVEMVTWSASPHVGHYRQYPVDYKVSITELLSKAAAIYSQRIQRLEGEIIDSEGTQNDISDPIFNLRKASASHSQVSEVLSLALNDQESLTDPNIDAHGVLEQILFDVCVPKDVEDWDIKQSHFHGRRGLFAPLLRRHVPFNAIKCILRSRL